MQTIFRAAMVLCVVGGAFLTVGGCERKVAETKTATGEVKFPDTGRPPTKEEMDRIMAKQQKRNAASPGAPAPKP